MIRNSHSFEFESQKISEAARTEAEYHEGRVDHWQQRADAAVEIVKSTIGAKVVEREQTGGKVVSIEVDYGNPTAWAEYQLAYRKINEHKAAADRYRTDEKLYGTQITRLYELDSEDVHHFRLGGQERPE